MELTHSLGGAACTPFGGVVSEEEIRDALAMVAHRTLLLIVLFAAARSFAANPYAWTGRSWEDPPLGEVLLGADLLAEVEVLVGGQFRADGRLVRVFRANAGESCRPGDIITFEGFNSYEWNTAYYAMREGERAILALYRAGKVYTLATPSSGRFPIDGRRVLARFGKQELLVEVPLEDFRAALEAFCEADRTKATSKLIEFLERGPIEIRYVAIEFLGALPDGAADEQRIQALGRLVHEANPVLREAAATALGRIGGPYAAKVLGPFIADADRIVARAGVLAACECGSGGAMREVVAWLERASRQIEGSRPVPASPHKEEQDAIMRVAQFISSRVWFEHTTEEERTAVIRTLKEMLASGQAFAAKLSIRLLGRIGASEAIDDLIRLMEAKDPELREEAAKALFEITLSPAAFRQEGIAEWWREHKASSSRRWIEEALELAEEALSEKSYEGMLLAQALLAASLEPLAPWFARKALVSGAGWTDAPLEEMGGPFVVAFAELGLASQSASRRLSAVRTLAGVSRTLSLGQRGFLRELMAASFDHHADVRSEALNALAELPGWACVARCLEELERGTSSASRKSAAKTLSCLTGRHLGYYESKGYELEEEARGLARWRDWSEDSCRREYSWPRRNRGRDRPKGDVSLFERTVSEVEPGAWLKAVAEFVADDAPSTQRMHLETLARSGHARIRAQAAALLGLRSEAESARVLVSLLSDDEPFVRAQAIWALGRALSGSASPPAGLLAIAKRASEDTVLRKLALVALGKIGGQEALEVLTNVVKGRVAGLTDAASLGLEFCNGEGAERALIDVLVSGPAESRWLAARAIARRKPAGAAAAIAKAFEQASYTEGYAFLEALAHVWKMSDSAAVSKLLDSEDDLAALAAAYVLSLDPGPEAVPALIRALQNGGPSVRYYSAKALGKLGRAGLISADAKALVSRALAARLGDPDAAVASSVAAALEYAGDESCADAVIRYLELYNPPDFRALGAAVRFGGKRGLKFALSVFKDGSWGAKYFALSALRYSQTDEALRLLIKTWRDVESPYQDVASRSLVALGPSACRSIGEILKNGTPHEKRRAARLLGEIGGKEALAILSEAAYSQDAELAAVVRLAIEKARSSPR